MSRRNENARMPGLDSSSRSGGAGRRGPFGLRLGVAVVFALAPLTLAPTCDTGVVGNDREPCEADGQACGPDEFCQRAACGEGEGQCTARPTACDASYDPVCGCDGETYGNQCEANGEGVSLAYEGECSGACTLDAKICPDGTEVGREGPDCEFAPCPGEGTPCTTELKLCPDGSEVGRMGPDCEFAPCPAEGCRSDGMICPDGTVVGREGPDCEFAPCPAEGCTLDAKICPDGTEVGREGPDCEFAPCPGEGKCGAGEFCEYPKSSRCGAGAECVCTPIPDACTDQYEPVCGCDGKTYSNACHARAEGASVLADGDCEVDACGGEAAMLCPDGTAVALIPPECTEFAPCPGEELACTLEIKICPDGTEVGRVAPACQFAPCPGDEPIPCQLDARVCSDGSSVGRVPPSCDFAPCP